MEEGEDIAILRPLTCELGQLTRPDGNVLMAQGETTVTIGVYGPGEVKMNKEIVDKATVEVIYKPRSGLPGCADKLFERTIRNTCETVLLTSLHPRSSITLVIQEMQNSGSFLASCVNACCLAMLDASVSMKYLVAGVTCSIDNQGRIVLDPTLKQEMNSVATLTLVFENKNFSIVTMSTKGKFTTEQFNLCVEASLEASRSVFNFFRSSIEKKLSKSV